jgi:hypothetical protein
MFSDDALDFSQFTSVEPMIISDQYVWFDPKLGALSLMVNMCMLSFSAIIRIKVKAIWTDS